MATEEEPRELFISYGREPGVIEFVSKLKQDLESSGFSVWLDMKDIQAGTDWHGAIGIGLYKCRGIIPIITTKYLSSRFCINELYTADGDKKLIFPIIYEDVDFNSSDTAMGVKFVISSINWTWLRPDIDEYHSNLAKFMQGMKLKGIGCETNDPSPPKPSESSHNAPPAPFIGPKITSQPTFRIPDIQMNQGITTGPNGEIICCSGAKAQVLVFDSDGKKIRSFGTSGIQAGELMNPSGVAVNEDGHLLVACHFSISKFTLEGECLKQYGGVMAPDSDPCKIQAPSAMAIGPSGRVYISEVKSNKIKIFDSDLSFVSEFTDADPNLGSGHLNVPQSLAVSSEGKVYVADMMNSVVQVFSSEGEFLFKFGGTGIVGGSTPTPSSLAIDSGDNVYVGSGTCSISIFKKNGVFVRRFGEAGAELGKFMHPRALHVDKNGRLYVGEWNNNRIQVFV